MSAIAVPMSETIDPCGAPERINQEHADVRWELRTMRVKNAVGFNVMIATAAAATPTAAEETRETPNLLICNNRRRLSMNPNLTGQRADLLVETG